MLVCHLHVVYLTESSSEFTAVAAGLSEHLAWQVSNNVLNNEDAREASLGLCFLTFRVADYFEKPTKPWDIPPATRHLVKHPEWDVSFQGFHAFFHPKIIHKAL